MTNPDINFTYRLVCLGQNCKKKEKKLIIHTDKSLYFNKLSVYNFLNNNQSHHRTENKNICTYINIDNFSL